MGIVTLNDSVDPRMFASTAHLEKPHVGRPCSATWNV
jgi:hypothetical protein